MRLRILVGATALLLSACSSGTGSVADGEPETVESPIAEFLGYDTFADFDSDEAQTRFEEQEREAQQAIATCMRNEGFEYTPVDYSQFDTFSELEGEEWGSAEWIEKYGYGISTQRFSQTAVGPDLIGYDDSVIQSYDDTTDPNSEYVNSLTPEEQEAYYAALYGQQPEPDIDFDNMTEEEINQAYDDFYENVYEPTGCQNTAYEELYSGDEVFGEGSPLFEFEQEFGDELEALFERIESDPRMIAAREKLTKCVVDKGYDSYIDDDSVYDDIESRMEPIQAAQFFDPTSDISEDVLETMTEEEFEELYNSSEGQELSADDKAILAEVQAYELGLAAAVDDCGGGYWNYQAGPMAEIRAEIEQEWLDINADRLATFEGVASSDNQ